MSEYDLLGDEIIKDVLLRDKFIEPPFSVLDTKQGGWQRRRREWVSRGLKGYTHKQHKGVNMNIKDMLNSFDCTESVVALVQVSGGVVAISEYNFLGGVCDCCRGVNISDNNEVLKVFDAITDEVFYIKGEI